MSGHGADSVDRSAALAALMTPVLRGAFEVTPLFFIDKPEAGTGGSYFVDLAATLATGHIAPPLATSRRQDEFDKELTAAAMEGVPILNLDNLSFDLRSDLLCKMVTAGMALIRPFRHNDKMEKCDCRGMTVYVNGNNIDIAGDLASRRTIVCRLDAKTERPEQRKFKHKPIETMLKNRGKYISAVFAIVKAYIASGHKVNVKPLDGLEEWMQKICHPLIWLDCQDPTLSIEELKMRDPDRDELNDLINTLLTQFGRQKFTAAHIHDAAVAMITVMRADGTAAEQPANVHLRSVFMREDRVMSIKAIGRLLAHKRGRHTTNGTSIERDELKAGYTSVFSISGGEL